MNLDTRIEMARPADSELVAELVHDLLMEFFSDQCQSFPIAKMKKASAQLLTPGSGFWSFLAMKNDEIVGVINLNECSAIYAGGKFGEITELYVKPDFRSQYIGGKLIAHALEFSKGKAWGVLEVGAPDVPRCQRTVNFYLQNGFSEVGPRLEKDV